jgi:hypothetical protein
LHVVLPLLLPHPGTIMQLQATVLNTGDVKWTAGGPLVFAPALSGVVCTTDGSVSGADPSPGDFTSGTHVLFVGHQVVCSGAYTFTHTDFEGIAAASGPKVFRASLPASAPAGWTVTDAADSSTVQAYSEQNVTTTVIASLAAVFDAASCTKPGNASSE